MTQSADEVTPMGLRAAEPCVFACGADLKSRFCFLKDGRLHLSEENGDLSDPHNFGRYLDSIRAMAHALRTAPDIIAYDLHPAYFSARAADLFPGARRVGVQHHRAHIASVVADSIEEGPVIGVAFDGAGYGTDGNIWGGEFLLVSGRQWSRRGHLEYLKMPGGDAAVREPWRMAFSLLYSVMGDGLFRRDFSFLKVAPLGANRVVKNMIDRSVNTPLTSSCGRLFDATASLLGIAQIASSEGAAAIALEKKASTVEDSGDYPFEIASREGVYRALHAPLVEAMVGDLERGTPVDNVARRFHNSLARLVLEMARRIGRDACVRTVALSGGVFQNRLLHSMARDLLARDGFRVLESGVPVNDLGICVGQTYMASRQL